MDYSLSDFLDQMRKDGGVALYLSEGLPPVVAMPGRPYDPDLASALLFEMEVPKLTRDKLKAFLVEINGSEDQEFTELRYKNGVHDLDVFVFANERRIHLEFRLPHPLN